MVPPVASLNFSIRSLITETLNALESRPPLYLKSELEQALFSQQVIQKRLQIGRRTDLSVRVVRHASAGGLQ